MGKLRHVTLKPRFVCLLAAVGLMTFIGLQSAEACDTTYYSLTLNIYGSGRVSLNGTYYSSSTVRQYIAGTTVNVYASPNSGYVFSFWTDALTGSSPSGTITMNGNKTLSAFFVPLYTLTTSVTGSGTVSGAGTYPSGTNVLLTAHPSSGWAFHHWELDLSGSNNPKYIAMNANKSVRAVFIQGYSLSTSASGSGQVSPSYGAYAPGTNVQVTATANSGWTFHHWEGDLSGSTNPATITMNSNKHVTAVFVQLFTLTTSVTGSGTVTPSGGTYASGTVVTLTATPSAGWRFHLWELDKSGSVNPTTITMSSNKSVRAVFVQQFTLSTSTTGTGSVVLNPAGGTYDSGSVVRMFASPAQGWRFDHWELDKTGSTNPVDMVMDSNKSVRAVFIQQFTLTTTMTGSGTITLNPPGGTYDTGTTVELTATPSSGWRFDRWELDLTGSTNPASVTMNANKSVRAVFIQQFTLTTSVLGSGSVAISPSLSLYDAGTTVTLTPTAYPGWRFGRWELDLTGESNPATITMDSNKTIRAVFIQQFGLDVYVWGSGGSTSPSGVNIYDVGTVVSVSATPIAGYRFDHWSGTIADTTENPVTLTLNEHHVLLAFFVKLVDVTTSVSPAGAGAVDPGGTHTYDKNTVVTFTAFPQLGWRFDHWSSSPSRISGTTNPISADIGSYNITVTATFVQQLLLVTSASPAQGGSLSPLGATRHDIGSTVTITPQASPGWRFDHWQGDLTGNANPGSVLMDAEKSVTGVFVETRTLTTSASPAEGGSVSPAGTTQQDHGTTVSVTATPAEGYRFSHWTGAISGSANPGSVTMNANKSVTAVFIRQFSLTTTASPSEGGSVSPAGTTVYDTGTSVSVSAQANTGWRFHHWEGDLSGTSSPSSVTMDAAKSVTAVFVQQFTLTTEVSPAGGGSITPSGTTIHDAGSNVTVDPEASSGWRFHHWEGALSGTTEPADVVMDGNKQVTAVFIEQFELTINIQGSGTVAADPLNGPYDNGTDVALTATPEPGWFLDHWEEDVTGSANPALVHMDADKMVTAVFTRIGLTLRSVTFDGVPLSWDDENWQDDMFNSEGSPILPPQWSDYGSVVEKPICIVRDASPRLEVIFALDPPVPTPICATIGAVWAVGPSTLAYQQDVTLLGDELAVELNTNDSMPHCVVNDDSSIEWTVSYDGSGTWTTVETTTNKTFVIYGTPYSGENNFNDDPWSEDMSFVLTVKRVDLLTGGGVNGKIVRKDIAQEVAIRIYDEYKRPPSLFGTGGAQWPVWRRLDPVNPTGGTPALARRLECYSGKILCAGALAMLGIPREYIMSRQNQEGCFARASTDNNSGPGYNSDCTDEEIPTEWCVAGSNCSVYGPHGQHPGHPSPGQPFDGNSVFKDWLLAFAGPSPCENFMKIRNGDSVWYYVTVVPTLPDPIPGDGTPGTDADKAGRYALMQHVLQSEGPQFWWNSVYEVSPADPLP